LICVEQARQARSRPVHASVGYGFPFRAQFNLRTSFPTTSRCMPTPCMGKKRERKGIDRRSDEGRKFKDDWKVSTFYAAFYQDILTIEDDEVFIVLIYLFVGGFCFWFFCFLFFVFLFFFASLFQFFFLIFLKIYYTHTTPGINFKQNYSCVTDVSPFTTCLACMQICTM
jgi:hypothetical protein